MGAGALHTASHRRDAGAGEARQLLATELESLGDQVPAKRQSPLAHQRRTADTLKASWHELDTGHYAMLTEPEKLAKLIMAG